MALPISRFAIRPASLARLPARTLALLLGGWGVLGCMEGPLPSAEARGAGTRGDAPIHTPR